MTLFSAIDPPLFPAAPWMHWARRLGVAPYRLLFRIPRAMVRRWEPPLREFRAELGLPATDPIAQFEGQHSPRLNLALFSRALAAPQPDWPANTIACGFPRYDGAPPDARVQARTRGLPRCPANRRSCSRWGPPPSWWRDDFWQRSDRRCAKARAARHTAHRQRRRSSIGAVPPTVRAFDYLPYSAVFPRALAIVHSGGIGTLAQALAAGRPQLIVPVAFDQPDNARRAVSARRRPQHPLRENKRRRVGAGAWQTARRAGFQPARPRHWRESHAGRWSKCCMRCAGRNLPGII